MSQSVWAQSQPKLRESVVQISHRCTLAHLLICFQSCRVHSITFPTRSRWFKLCLKIESHLIFSFFLSLFLFSSFLFLLSSFFSSLILFCFSSFILFIFFLFLLSSYSFPNLFLIFSYSFLIPIPILVPILFLPFPLFPLSLSLVLSASFTVHLWQLCVPVLSDAVRPADTIVPHCCGDTGAVVRQTVLSVEADFDGGRFLRIFPSDWNMSDHRLHSDAR